MRTKKMTLTCFMVERIRELRNQQRDGTAHVYQSTLNRIQKFAGNKDVSFDQISPKWLIQFEKSLVAQQLKWNTISTYMRMLRAVYNQAIDCGIAKYVPRLFHKVHTGVDSPVKRAIKPETMHRIMMTDGDLKEDLAFTRDMFVLLFLLRGMSFVDLAYLRRSDLDGNIITYRRHKTGRKLTVVAGKEAMAIIGKYANRNPQSLYLLPIIKQPGKNEYRQYANMLRTMNHRLAKVSRNLRLSEKLSTYVARHTWATTAVRQNYNTHLICDAMGHSSVKVTETYFQRFREDEVNRMNNNIVTYILSSVK